jgi:hypothetical protein
MLIAVLVLKGPSVRSNPPLLLYHVTRLGVKSHSSIEKLLDGIFVCLGFQAVGRSAEVTKIRCQDLALSNDMILLTLFRVKVRLLFTGFLKFRFWPGSRIIVRARQLAPNSHRLSQAADDE